jgi:hypothetical protein
MDEHSDQHIREELSRRLSGRGRPPGLGGTSDKDDGSSSRREVRLADEQKGEPMPVEADAVYWPEHLDKFEDGKPDPEKRRILHVRHRVGDYDVTRLVLGSVDELNELRD